MCFQPCGKAPGVTARLGEIIGCESRSHRDKRLNNPPRRRSVTTNHRDLGERARRRMLLSRDYLNFRSRRGRVAATGQ